MPWLTGLRAPCLKEEPPVAKEQCCRVLGSLRQGKCPARRIPLLSHKGMAWMATGRVCMAEQMQHQSDQVGSILEGPYPRGDMQSSLWSLLGLRLTEQ
jgi:hypothetical protein